MGRRWPRGRRRSSKNGRIRANRKRRKRTKRRGNKDMKRTCRDEVWKRRMTDVTRHLRLACGGEGSYLFSGGVWPYFGFWRGKDDDE